MSFAANVDLDLYGFPCAEPLTHSIADRLGAGVQPLSLHHFPDGESLIRAPRGPSDRALIVRSLDRPNRSVIEVLLAADALRRQGVRQIGLVTPYLGYMRQDRVFQEGEPISQQVIANLLSSVFDSVTTVEAHLHRIRRLSDVFHCRATSLSAASPVADWIRSHGGAQLLIGPDSESAAWIQEIAKHSGSPFCVGRKTRHSDHRVEIDLPATDAELQSAWIVDDIASSGGTLETLAKVLKDRGVEHIHAIVVHALFAPGTVERLEAAGIETLITTDSIPHPTNRISLAPILSRAIQNALEEPRRQAEAS